MKMLQVALIGLFLLTGACGPIMPEGFRNLAIGMTWKELIQARPDAIIGSLDPWIEDTPDPEKPRKGLSEMINTGPIKGVLYVFNDGRLSSLSFIYSSEIGIDDSLLRELLDRYGEYENIQASSETGRGIVKWITGNLYLYLVKPFENEEGRDEDVVYQIMDMQMAQEIEAVHSAKLRKKPVDKIGLQVYKSRVQALSNSVLTQETQEPVVAAETTPELEPTGQRKLQPKPTTKFIFGDEPDEQVIDEQHDK